MVLRIKNKITVPLLLFFIFNILSAYDVQQFSKTYIDTSRDNRPILTKIYYPVETREELFPTIVFGHGWLMSYSNYAQLSQFLTSKGWIVALPETEQGLFPDHNEFALDLAFVANSLQIDNNNPDAVLYNMVDSISVAMGHSMGGGCAILSTAESNIFDGMVTFAAAETNPSAIIAALNVDLPSITYSAANDNITPPASHQIPIYENLASSYKGFVSILNEDHLGITSNQIAFNCTLPFLQYVVHDNISYLNQFEDSLDYYANLGNVQYEIINNINSAEVNELKMDYNLKNSPNPFHNYTKINFTLVKPALVDLIIFNAKGEKVKSLVNEVKTAGSYNVTWHARNHKGNTLSSGLYFYNLVLDNSINRVGKCILLK